MTTSLNEHTKAVLAVLEAIADLGVYRGGGPESPHEHTPYAVVTPHPATWSGPSGDPHADVDYRVQIKAVGTSPEQADEAADRVRTALLAPAATLAPTGRVMRGPVACEPLRPASRDDDGRLVTPLWMADDLYVIPTTPGGS